MCFCWPASFCGFGGAGGVGWGWGAMGSGAVMFLGLSPHLLAVVGWTVVFLRALGVARGGGGFSFLFWLYTYVRFLRVMQCISFIYLFIYAGC